MRESVRLDHDRWHACANSIFFSSLRIPGGMCGERADEVGEVIERRYIGHNSSHNTPIATPSPLGRADELWSHGLDADRLAPTNRGTERDLQTGDPAVRERATRSTSDLHGVTTDTVGRDPIKVPMPDSQHSAIARDPECFLRSRTETAELLMGGFYCRTPYQSRAEDQLIHITELSSRVGRQTSTSTI